MKEIIKKFSTHAIYLFTAALVFSCSSDDDGDDIPTPEPKPEIATPAANFSSEIISATIPFDIPKTIEFTDTSTNLVQEATYTWDFGDSSGTSTEKNPTYTYEKGGTYTVSLTVTNAENKTNTFTAEVELSSPLVGTWKLNPDAANTTQEHADVKGGMEFGEIAGWDDTQWTVIGEGGYSTFWSNAIFSGNYFERTSIFDVAYTIGADGSFERQINGDYYVHYAGEQTLSEDVDWNDGGDPPVSLNGYKSSSDMSWTIAENPGNAETAVITTIGDESTVPFLGIYFAGNTEIVSETCTYVVSVADENQLIVSGISNLFPDKNLFVLKFKRVDDQ
ncbi:MAG: PKD domain-containing protein [Flavobacteriaceae bacterium]|nr:PKD domain-containing protein [Flavobacteriaceae bacterium]